MKIYLDDIRFPKNFYDKFVIIRDYHDFWYTWENFKNEITEISFDHDLGNEKDGITPKTGYDAICLVEYDILCGNVNHFIKLNCHSANPSGAKKIFMAIDKINQFFIDNSIN